MSPKQQTSPSSQSLSNYPQFNSDTTPESSAPTATRPISTSNKLSAILLEIGNQTTTTTNTANSTNSTKPHSTSPTNRKSMLAHHHHANDIMLSSMSKSQSNLTESSDSGGNGGVDCSSRRVEIMGGGGGMRGAGTSSTGTSRGVVMRKNLSRHAGFRHVGSEGTMLNNENMLLFDTATEPVIGGNVPIGTVKRQVDFKQ